MKTALLTSLALLASSVHAFAILGRAQQLWERRPGDTNELDLIAMEFGKKGQPVKPVNTFVRRNAL